ncbi:50S ribosomal protein L16 [Candidatus Woesearchaeota archaeon]|nr:50S ribosomal protein L16 [Candidatus Woesearchaeota archaeon]
MARIRKFTAYRAVEPRAYTRISKFKDRNFIKASPHINIVVFDMGNPRKKFGYELNLISKDNLQIRHQAMESARMTCNRLLESTLGKSGYYLKVRFYPFHILRENPLAAGAGADRMSTGMKHSFGKPIGRAAQIRKGQSLLTLKTNKQNLETAKKALKRASYKFPCGCLIEVKELAAKPKKTELKVAK